jgi:hypothetical protein
MVLSGNRYSWPKEMDAMLRDMWGRGKSASIIVKALHEAGYPTTRNAVLGKVHRLNLTPRTTQTRTYKDNPKRRRLTDEERQARADERRRLRELNAMLARRSVVPDPEPWDGPSINILADNLKRHQCRFIVGGRGPTTMFCGAPTDPNSQFTFCAFHRASLTRVSSGRTHSDATKERMRRAHLARARAAEAA